MADRHLLPQLMLLQLMLSRMTLQHMRKSKAIAIKGFDS